VPVDKKDILTSELAVFDNFEFEQVLNKGEKEVDKTRIEGGEGIGILKISFLRNILSSITSILS